MSGFRRELLINLVRSRSWLLRAMSRAACYRATSDFEKVSTNFILHIISRPVIQLKVGLRFGYVQFGVVANGRFACAFVPTFWISVPVASLSYP